VSPNKRSTDNLLRRYLNGALTAPEEAELERRALTDEPLAEAMRGLQAHPEADHEAHVGRMLQRARSQVQGKVGRTQLRARRRNYARFAAAASVLLLFVSGAVWFLPQWIEMDPGDMGMRAPREAPVAAKQVVLEPDVAVEDGITFEDVAAVIPPETKAEPKPASPAPSSSAPNLRPRPSATPPAEEKAEAFARERAKAKQDQTTRKKTAQETGIASATETTQMDDDPIAEEAIVAEAAPPPAPQVAPAPMAAPRPSISADETVNLFEADISNSPAVIGANRGDYLEGRITNENGVPILNALVRLPGLPLGERTDSSGYFRLSADATTTRLEVSHPDYDGELVDLRGRPESLQISLDRKEWQPDTRPGFTQNAARTLIILDNKPGYAAPLEGYGTLRKRLETNRPLDVPKGKVKFSFTVNTDGTLTDFEFRGQPGRTAMDYIGKTLVESSVWEIMQGEEPVRVYMKVVF
jgi:hypothetical protein